MVGNACSSWSERFWTTCLARLSLHYLLCQTGDHSNQIRSTSMLRHRFYQGCMMIVYMHVHCQVYSNFKHKSTEGLSVCYVLLELIGGTFSVLQMLLLAYNFGKIYYSVCVFMISIFQYP